MYTPLFPKLSPSVDNKKGRKLLFVGDSIDRFMLRDWCERNNRNHLMHKSATETSLFDNLDALLTTQVEESLKNYKSNMKVGRLEPFMDLHKERTLSEPGENKSSSLSIFMRHPHHHRQTWNQPSICVDIQSGDSIAAAHLFGSPPAGPYYYNFSNNELDKYIDTKPRVEFILKTYLDKFGPPDRLILHTLQWDKKRFYDIIGHGIRPNEAQLWQDKLNEYENDTRRLLDNIE